jgi:hypothetical protein
LFRKEMAKESGISSSRTMTFRVMWCSWRSRLCSGVEGGDDVVYGDDARSRRSRLWGRL